MDGLCYPGPARRHCIAVKANVAASQVLRRALLCDIDDDAIDGRHTRVRTYVMALDNNIW